METEALPVEQLKPLPVPDAAWERWLYVLIVTLLPIICFSLGDLVKPEWQSGKLSDYAALLLSPSAAWFFFPFLIYSVVCLVLLAIEPRRFAARFVVRLGIYTGLLLSLQYAIVIVLAIVGGALICLVSAGLLLAAWSVMRKARSNWLRVGIVVFLFSAVLVIGLATGSLGQAPIMVIVLGLAAAPFLCLAVAGVTTYKLARYYEGGLSASRLVWALAGLAGWLAAYGLAWRFSILKAIELYQALPPAPPDCYVATASARGHRRLVHSRPVATPTGTLLVTRQLQLLKCAELALLALAPRAHRLVRSLYDRFGPPLARRLTNPFMADAAYLAFKPFEWTAGLVLKILVPEIDEYAGRLYSFPG